MFCKKCNKEIIGRAAGNHKRWCTGPGYIKGTREVLKQKTCLNCNQVFEFKGRANPTQKQLNAERSFCSGKCQSTHVAKSSNWRKKISESRKKWLKNNPEKHPWKKKNKHTSVPCENLKQYFRDNNISFVAEHQPLDDRYFSIDIAFPNEKIGIEVNGNQHYNRDKTLKKYYKDRNDLIESSGWKIHNIHYSHCFSDENMEKILLHIKKNATLDYVYEFEIKKKKDTRKCEALKIKKKKVTRKYGARKDAGKAQSANWLKQQQKYIPVILNSGIDFSKFGWVGRAAKLINQKPQKVSGWMKRVMPDFYKEKCFRRKASI